MNTVPPLVLVTHTTAKVTFPEHHTQSALMLSGHARYAAVGEGRVFGGIPPR